MKIHLLLLACIGIGVGRVAATYPIFNQTWDEPAHLAAGMEWLSRGQYTYEPLHPPLARVMVALGPWADGLRTVGFRDVWLEGNALLYSGGRYYHNLTLARVGTLPFFILAALVVFAWARRLHGPGPALLAVLLFTTLPPVLAHAGLATTDLAVAATVALAAFVAVRWTERRTLQRSAALGASLGLAILTKFSALLFLPAIGVAIALSRRTPRGESPPAGDRGKTAALRACYLSLLLVVWAGYRFSVGTLTASPVPDTSPAPAAERLARVVPVPAPALFTGIGQLAAKDRAGHKAYLLGAVSQTGWWYFFPVALLVKTPLAFLLLVVAAAILARGHEREPLLIAAAILIVCLPSRINIGLRHLLPIYPFLAIAAGGALGGLWRFERRRRLAQAAAALLLGWHLATSVRAHPDYIAYFNELVGSRPERILVDSDLDDGQDLDRLADTLRARGIRAVALAYAGSATVAEHGLPPVTWLQRHVPVTGWVAASLYSLKLGSLDRPGHDDFAWLESYRPVARAGASILLYCIPSGDFPSRDSLTSQRACDHRNTPTTRR